LVEKLEKEEDMTPREKLARFYNPTPEDIDTLSFTKEEIDSLRDVPEAWEFIGLMDSFGGFEQYKKIVKETATRIAEAFDSIVDQAIIDILFASEGKEV
jgi:hypothetical protein